MLLFHPGDLGISGLLMLLGLVVVLVALLIFFVVLMIYKVAARTRTSAHAQEYLDGRSAEEASPYRDH